MCRSGRRAVRGAVCGAADAHGAGPLHTGRPHRPGAVCGAADAHGAGPLHTGRPHRPGAVCGALLRCLAALPLLMAPSCLTPKQPAGGQPAGPEGPVVAAEAPAAPQAAREDAQPREHTAPPAGAQTADTRAPQASAAGPAGTAAEAADAAAPDLSLPSPPAAEDPAAGLPARQPPPLPAEPPAAAAADSVGRPLPPAERAPAAGPAAPAARLPAPPPERPAGAKAGPQGRSERKPGGEKAAGFSPAPSPAGAARAPSSAAGPPPAPPLAAAGEAGAAAPAPREREVYARRNDQVEIALDGEGWIFLGSRAAQAGLSPQGREESRGRTLFRYRAEKLGEYALEFQLQDHARGGTRSERVRVLVLTEDQFLARLAASRGEPPGAPAPAAGPVPAAAGASGPPAGGLALADRLFQLSRFPEALEEYLRNYGEETPELNDRIGTIYLRLGQYEAAARYFEKNRQAPPDLDQRAVLGLVRSALGAGDSRRMVRLLDDLVGVQDLPIEEELLAVSRFLLDRREAGIAAGLLQEYLSRYPQGSRRDEVYLLLGGVHEGDSPLRDLQKAREYYRMVVDGFPESPFHAAAAGRLQYLDRHFFYVR